MTPTHDTFNEMLEAAADADMQKKDEKKPQKVIFCPLLSLMNKEKYEPCITYQCGWFNGDKGCCGIVSPI